MKATEALGMETGCQWCGQGTYRQVFVVRRDEHGRPQNLYELGRYGISIQGNNVPEIWASKCCGHLAIIRPDLKTA